MDTFVHTFLALGSLMGAYYAGKHFGRSAVLDNAIIFLLDKLEKDGFIATKKDKDGEKDLIPISTIVAKALRDASKVSPKKVKEGY